jgi:hypothetical protein
VKEGLALKKLLNLPFWVLLSVQGKPVNDISRAITHSLKSLLPLFSIFNFYA